MKSPLEIAAIASSRAFGARLVTNVYRGLFVEAIVSTALCDDWKWCSEDWYAFDFRHSDGAGLEVKQSAACQSWETKVPSVARWDIAARKGLYEGSKYIEKPGRNAAIYVFAWHSSSDRTIADHRDPMQWEFFVVRSVQLKPTKTMGISGARKLTAPVDAPHLARAVSHALALYRCDAGGGDLSSDHSS